MRLTLCFCSVMKGESCRLEPPSCGGPAKRRCTVDYQVVVFVTLAPNDAYNARHEEHGDSEALTPCTSAARALKAD